MSNLYRKYQFLRTRRKLLHIIYFAFICAGGAALFLSLERHPVERDLTHNHLNSLSATSKALIKQIKAPLEITIYSVDEDTITGVKSLAHRYQIGGLQVKLMVLNQALPPELQQRFNVKTEAASIRLAGQEEWILLQQRHLTESLVTETIYRLHTQHERWAVFLDAFEPEINAYFETFQNLQHRLSYMGMHTASLHNGTGEIPQNTTLLVASSDTIARETSSIEKVQTFVEHGGNLLLIVPQIPEGKTLEFIQRLGIDVLLPQQPQIPFIQFKETTNSRFTVVPALWASSEHTHSLLEETVNNGVTEDEKLVGFLLKRPMPFGAFPHEQRILVIGGPDLVTSTSLQNFWKDEIQWLITDESIKVNYQEAKDLKPNLLPGYHFYLDWVLCLFIPALFAGLGWLCVIRQKNPSVHSTR